MSEWSGVGNSQTARIIDSRRQSSSLQWLVIPDATQKDKVKGVGRGGERGNTCSELLQPGLCIHCGFLLWAQDAYSWELCSLQICIFRFYLFIYFLQKLVCLFSSSLRVFSGFFLTSAGFKTPQKWIFIRYFERTMSLTYQILLGNAEIEVKVENNGNLREKHSFGKSFGQVIQITLNCLPCAAETLSAYLPAGNPAIQRMLWNQNVSSKCLLGQRGIYLTWNCVIQGNSQLWLIQILMKFLP